MHAEFFSSPLMFKVEIHDIRIDNKASIPSGIHALKVSGIHPESEESIRVQISGESCKIQEKKELIFVSSVSRVTITLMITNRPVAHGSFFVEECEGRVVPLYTAGGGVESLHAVISVQRMSSVKSSPNINSISPQFNEKIASHKEDTSATDLIGHFFSDLGSTRHLIETHRRWLLMCGPLRFIHRELSDIVTWTRIDATLLFMLLWAWFCMSPSSFLAVMFPSAIVGTWYVRVLMNNVVFVLERPPLEDLNENLSFNEDCMNSWCKTYEKVATLNLVGWLDRGWIVIVILSIGFCVIPINLLALCLVNGLILCRLPLSDNVCILASIPSVLNNDKVMTFEVYENQRWWLGNWSDKGLSIGTGTIHPWSDKSGHASLNKTSITLPSQEWDWDGLWQVDRQGWLYAINFVEDESAYHSSQKPSDFIRRRRWIRNARRIA
jgi:hypothetical protein